MNIPVLMPFQMEPFNGDIHVETEIVRLKGKFGLKNAIETGTCLGSSTLWLSQVFEKVVTIESNIEYLQIAHERFKEADLKNVKTDFGHSGFVLEDAIVMNEFGDDTFFFLDAHWYDDCPLLDELEQIANCKIKPVIAIHDFYVPGTDLGYDNYKGQRFDIEWIRPHLKKIYGDFGFHYNSEAIGARRGLIFIYPSDKSGDKVEN